MNYDDLAGRRNTVKGEQFNPITGLDPQIANAKDTNSKPSSRRSNTIHSTRADQEKRAKEESPWNQDPQELPPPPISGKRTTFAEIKADR